MQMVYDRHTGISLGAIVEDHGSSSKSSALTSYTVDETEPLSPLGVSLKWNHVNMKSHVVRGMPYGTVRFGKTKNKFELPTVLSGNRIASILLDSDDTTNSNEGEKMLCGSLTGHAIKQDPAHRVPLTSDGKPRTYTVQREIILHMEQSDFTWVAFFSKPVKVECYSDAKPAVSVPGADAEVQFMLRVTEVLDGENETKNKKSDKNDDEELVVRMAVLNQCTTGKATIKEHCDHLKSLGYKSISSKEKTKEYLEVLRKGAMQFPKTPLVGTQFPEEEEDDGQERATNVFFDWDVTSSNSGNGGESAAKGGVAPMSPTIEASSLRAATASLPMDTADDSKNDESDFIMFALPHHLDTLASTSTLGDDPLCLHTFHGRTCLVRGATWNLRVEHGAPQSFVADRPPMAKVVPSLAEALRKDVHFKLSDNILRGAADTYFPVSYAMVAVLLFAFPE